MLGDRLFAHHFKVVIEAHETMVEAFDRNTFDDFLIMQNLELLLIRINDQDNAMPTEFLLDIVALVIDRHSAIGAHLAGDPFVMQAVQPGVRIDYARYGRQGWWLGMRHARGLIPARDRLVRTFEVIVVFEMLVDLPRLTQITGTMDLHTLTFVGAVVALHKGIEVRASGQTGVRFNTQAEHETF